jgi:hypothetical protein
MTDEKAVNIYRKGENQCFTNAFFFSVLTIDGNCNHISRLRGLERSSFRSERLDIRVPIPSFVLSATMMTCMFKATVVVLIGAGLCAGEEEFVTPHSLSFFGRFAAEKNRNKFHGRLDCVYGDPIKGKMCPPVMNDPMAPLKSQEAGAGASSYETLTGGLLRFIYRSEENESKADQANEATKEESALALFSRCLDDPDSPDCRQLQTGVVSPAGHIASAPAHGRHLVETVSPTIDDCGGNMFDVSCLKIHKRVERSSFNDDV